MAALAAGPSALEQDRGASDKHQRGGTHTQCTRQLCVDRGGAAAACGTEGRAHRKQRAHTRRRLETYSCATCASIWRLGGELMSIAAELKIVFTGPMGAGKTTAITAVSDFPPVSTEMHNNDQQRFRQGIDHGRARPRPDRSGRRHGRALVRHARPGTFLFHVGDRRPRRHGRDPAARWHAARPCSRILKTYTEVFRRIAPEQPFVVGVGRTRPDDYTQIDACMRVLEATAVSPPRFSASTCASARTCCC